MEGKDLTKGNLFKNMVKLVVPLILINLLNSIYNIVDGIWIGKLIGENGIAAITNCYPIIIVVTSISIGISIATSVLVSQYYGEKDKEKIKKVMGVAYILSVIIGIFSVLIIIFTETVWLQILNTPKEILDITKQYLHIYLIGSMFNFIFIVISDSLKAIGNTKVPLIIIGISSIINIILDPILIKIGLGIVGTAIATLISMLISTIIAIIYVNKKSKLLKIDFKYLKLNKEYIKQFLKIGLPVMLEEGIFAFVASLEVYISNGAGIIGSASYGVISKLEQIIIVIGGSFKTMATVTCRTVYW